jgi:hypothetical protein
MGAAERQQVGDASAMTAAGPVNRAECYEGLTAGLLEQSLQGSASASFVPDESSRCAHTIGVTPTSMRSA